MQGSLQIRKLASICFQNDQGLKVTEVSQMPCRVSSDVHEWNNEGPAVPAYNPVKPHKLDEQSSIFHRGEKTPWSFTAACACGMAGSA